MARNPIRGNVAIAGVGSTTYERDSRRTDLALGLEAAVRAIEDAGIDRQSIDGICGSGRDTFSEGQANYLAVQGALGIDETTWVLNAWLGCAFVYAVEAVASGLADTVLVVQTSMRGVTMSRSAVSDPFRVRAGKQGVQGAQSSGPLSPDPAQRWIHSGEPYAAWMGRYLAEFGATKEVFGRLAINNRSHASRNPAAAMRTPITMEDYLSSRPIWEPMQMLDMDVPVDCGEALIITTAERASDLKRPPVYVNAASLGGTRIGEHYEQGIAWDKLAPWAAMNGLWKRTDLTAGDMDIVFPYDGFTINAIGWIEASGYCGSGEATDLLSESWDDTEQILRLGGHTLVSTNGGSLSHGRAGGSNYYAEAVRQLRGSEGERQVPGAGAALVGVGSFYHDPAAAILTSQP